VVNKYRDDVVIPAFDAIAEAGGAHAKITHSYSGKIPPWWWYSVDEVAGRKAIGWDWVDKPKKPKNLELGNAYYLASERVRTLYGRLRMFNDVLEYAISKKIRDIEQKDDTPLHLIINGRDYWYSSRYNRWGGREWSKMAWPEDETITVEWK